MICVTSSSSVCWAPLSEADARTLSLSLLSFLGSTARYDLLGEISPAFIKSPRKAVQVAAVPRTERLKRIDVSASLLNSTLFLLEKASDDGGFSSGTTSTRVPGSSPSLASSSASTLSCNSASCSASSAAFFSNSIASYCFLASRFF